LLVKTQLEETGNLQVRWALRGVKIFDLAVVRTGLRDTEADGAGFQPRTVELTAFDHKIYYPGAHPLRIRITGDQQTGLLLGAQIIGHYHCITALIRPFQARLPFFRTLFRKVGYL
jgi:NADPH-dependent 2,4-dienoyl-CoA reductase/sulfur reductase-like enzyme